MALIGPNGAGKSLLLESLVGVRSRRSGSVSLCGHPLDTFMKRPSLKRLFGAQLQDVHMIARIRVDEIVDLHKKLYGPPDPLVTNALNMDELLGMTYQILSRGQKQRVQLFLALAHRPPVVFLDEPTLGLDEWHAHSVRQIWQSRRDQGQGQLVISHVGADLACASHIHCLSTGQIIEGGTLNQLMLRHVGLFRAELPTDVGSSVEDAIARLSGLLRPPYASGDKWVMFGKEGFDIAFRELIDRHGLTRFHLDSTCPEDLLAVLSGEKA